MYEDYTPLADWMTKHEPGKSYGFFGYKGMAIESVLKRDDPEAIREAHKRGWIDRDTQTIDNTPLRRRAKSLGGGKVADALGQLGYPE